MNNKLKIREIGGGCYYSLEFPWCVNKIYFNSKQNAETVKHIIEVDGSKPNTTSVCEMEEVKHGKWEEEDTIMGTYARCSVCHFDEMYADFQYCPHCGAKMDLEE